MPRLYFNKNTIKNVGIMFLVILLFINIRTFLLYELSFYNSYSQNILNKNNFFNEEYTDLLKPYKTLKFIDNDFGFIYNVNNQKMYNNIMSEVTNEGQFTGSYKLTTQSLFDKDFLLYKFSFDVPVYLFKNVFSKLKSLQNFDSVIIFMNDTPKQLEIVFWDSKNDEGYNYEVNNSNLKEDLLFYARSRSFKSLDTLSGENSIMKINPYLDNGDLLISKVEEKVNIFFSNPAYKNIDLINESFFMYSMKYTIVKYLRGLSILEYFNYKIDSDDNKAALIDNYEAAKNMLYIDREMIKHQYYLTGYEEDDNQALFYFSLLVNGFPIRLSKNMDMQAPIEISVSDGVVINYKRYVFNYETQDAKGIEMNINFDELVESDLFYNIDKTDISSLYIEGV